MRKKPMEIVLYLMACTLLIFYMPKIITAVGGAWNTRTEKQMSSDSMDQNAYYSLREVAGVQLGHIVITYSIDETTGRCRAKFRNAACPSPQAGPEEIKTQQKALQEDLHEQILLLEPYVDADKSGYIDKEEGAQFRDLYEFGHMVAHGFTSENLELGELAGATGKTEAEVAEDLQSYRNLVAGCSSEIQKFFPQI